MNAQQRYKELTRFRDAYAELLTSRIDTGEMVRRIREMLAPGGEFHAIAEDAAFWLMMEHGLDVEAWERRGAPR